ncbi:MAG TPA: LysM peptidoglycan-binding domain-containing protein [Chloroflexota bacterium]|nr:LysM peptidoglycan-binding domain-containing protein [Chloroflexota bacterium]
MRKGEMNNEEPGDSPPAVVIKVAGLPGDHACAERSRSGRTSPQHIPLWTKWRWRAAYWRHSRWQPPEWKSPYWLALSGTLLLVIIFAAVSTAYEEEPELRRRAVEMQALSSGGSVNVAPQPPVVTAGSPAIYATGSAIYVVQPDDTLYRIASRYNTTIEALDQINQLNSTVSVGQVLVIPSADWRSGGTASAGVSTDQYACAQFSFHQGERSAQAGVYALHDVMGGQIAAWSAPAGAMASGWIYDLPVAFASVHARVLFYPRYGGGTAVEMTILNHAPDTSAGLCHSLELAYP